MIKFIKKYRSILFLLLCLFLTLLMFDNISNKYIIDDFNKRDEDILSLGFLVSIIIYLTYKILVEMDKIIIKTNKDKKNK